MAWGFGYFGQPHILARFKAVHSASEIGPARRIAVTWVIVTLGAALVVGLVGIPYFDPSLASTDSEKVFLLLVDAAFPPLLAGFSLAAEVDPDAPEIVRGDAELHHRELVVGSEEPGAVRRVDDRLQLAAPAQQEERQQGCQPAQSTRSAAVSGGEHVGPPRAPECSRLSPVRA